ncbi:MULTISPECIES: carbonic anhydrase [Sporomusa]|uniref:carbonic anhydrase n=1 Tax=Sporomusa TaxID=2375 RepID=UPI00166F541B|nr:MULTISPECIES: carbonic anhydrase [Sporomusa]HML34978.1 carbonic anhydrase [Sporomusa sphaeroides]
MDAFHALEKLLHGNRRYVTERYAKTDVGLQRRSQLVTYQDPFAVILGCSDSRIPPEIIFDQGLGDLFVVRTAGQVVADVVLGSIEYAVEHLNVRLVVVLGHGDCGAVKAAINNSLCLNHIETIKQAIQPAVQKASTQSGELLTNTIKANVEFGVWKLKTSSPILQRALTKKGLHIIGAIKDLHTGSVDFDIVGSNDFNGS